jgi:glutamine amidotransferase
MIVIVDYGMGNLKSVENSALFLGTKVKVSASRAVIKKAGKIIFPGVGNFLRAVKELKKRKLFDLLKARIAEGVPFLGICLGMQLLLERSREAAGVKGLGVIKGEVREFTTKKLIIPHMGWNKIRIKEEGEKRKLFRAVKDGSYFYFAHSYYCRPEDKRVVLTTTVYGNEFASSLHKDNIWAVQFHPEKSQALGLKVFNNFLKLC